jgi:hypothetical protein
MKDLLVVVGIPGAFIAAWKTIEEFKNSNIEKAKATAEKARENRHKQAAAARDALREVFASEKARAAMQMLDWSGRSYSDGTAAHVITFDDLGPALRTDNLMFTNPKEPLIRDCFEDLFDRLELIQHYIEIDFLHFGDVSVPLAYYARKIVKNLKAFQPFLDEYGYPKAKAFLLRAAQ